MDDASLKTMGFEIREHKYNKIELFEKYDCFALTGFVDDIEIYLIVQSSNYNQKLVDIVDRAFSVNFVSQNPYTWWK